MLGVFLWPLISSHDVGLWLEPVLQKLDFGIGEFLQKIKENHGNYASLSYVETVLSSICSKQTEGVDVNKRALKRRLETLS